MPTSTVPAWHDVGQCVGGVLDDAALWRVVVPIRVVCYKVVVLVVVRFVVLGERLECRGVNNTSRACQRPNPTTNQSSAP